MEDRGQQLDLAARDAVLAHPAAVHRDALGLAVRVEREQRAQAAGAARLDVDGADRVHRRRREVVDRVDRRVVGDAAGVRGERPGDLGQVVRVLEERVGEGRDDALVEGAERRGVLDLHPVLALEVDDVDGAGGGEVLADRERPGGGGVELEVDVRVVGEAAVDRVGRRRVAEAERVDEGERARLALEHLVQRAAGLAQREVERGGLVGPVAPEPREDVLRRRRPLLERREVVGEAPEGPLARERQLGRDVGERIGGVGEHGDVLAEALVARSAQPDQDRRADHAAGQLGGERFELVALDDERELREARPE